MTTNSYTIQKRERNPESEKTLFEILNFAEKFSAEKNCKTEISIIRKNADILEIKDFESLERLDNSTALELFKLSTKKVEILNKYVYQNYPVLDNNPEEDKPSFIVELLKLEIYL